jgi:hypothetical protein
MATAEISSQFDITIQGADLNTAQTFTASRSFRIVGITAVNSAVAENTLTVTAGASGGEIAILTATTAAPPVAGAGVVQAQAVAGPTNAVSVLDTALVTKGDIVSLQTGDGLVSRVILHCTGNPSESIVIS